MRGISQFKLLVQERARLEEERRRQEACGRRMMNSGRHVCTEVGDCKVATTAAQANATVVRPCSAEQEREAIEKARAEAEAFVRAAQIHWRTCTHSRHSIAKFFAALQKLHEREGAVGGGREAKTGGALLGSRIT